MNGPSLEIPSLFVEGGDDLHTIIHLLRRHGIALDKTLGPIVIRKASGDNGVLNAISTATRASTNRPVGFVIDANGSVKARWKAVCGHLAQLDVHPPSKPPPKGFVGSSEKFKTTVGVWIMPDNVTSFGKLEHFVERLVPTDDALYDHAITSTDAAKKLGSEFTQPDRVKAVLHCWLAWQREPGLPFGTAIKAQFLRHDSPTAAQFVDWFKRLYGLP